MYRLHRQKNTKKKISIFLNVQIASEEGLVAGWMILLGSHRPPITQRALLIILLSSPIALKYLQNTKYNIQIQLRNAHHAWLVMLI